MSKPRPRRGNRSSRNKRSAKPKEEFSYVAFVNALGKLKLTYDKADITAEYTPDAPECYYFSVKWRGADCWYSSPYVEAAVEGIMQAMHTALGPSYIPLLPLLCPYCNEPAKTYTGKERYPNRADLHCMRIWWCRECDASVTCHAYTNKPKGTLADKGLRRQRMRAHQLLDPLWEDIAGKGHITRDEAYRRLAEKLNLEPEACHIGMFNDVMCKKAINAILEMRQELKEKD